MLHLLWQTLYWLKEKILFSTCIYCILAQFNLNVVHSAPMEDRTENTILSSNGLCFPITCRGGWLANKERKDLEPAFIWNVREAVAMTMTFCRFLQSSLWDQRRSDMTIIAQQM